MSKLIDIIIAKNGVLLSGTTGNLTVRCANGHVFNKPCRAIYAKKWCQQCPKMSESAGEKTIREYLENKEIAYKAQKTYIALRGYTYLRRNRRKSKKLPFDFGHVKGAPFCIEFDGQQHFEYSAFFSNNDIGQYHQQQEYDIKKSQFCVENSIPLLRIDYTCDKDKIYQMLNDFFVHVYNRNFVVHLSDVAKYSYLDM
ncbi:MAG: hypothetical protein Faunusvirus1_8 [Faunusvirus sp.]|jgi:hypothetical protein|uniref:Uncharacterized protein n=1 Tax=Faunusvirus sp. TaxID=2487766 RepID=A0A3G4ZVQ4_9VIRU|nr:MAG: hypothetical protein Faunusvirus1_8 [Faunusvirus sp.]